MKLYIYIINLIKKQILKGRLSKESKLVAKSSKEILVEFEKLTNEL